MRRHAYTQNQLVKQPAIGLFVERGWQVAVPPPTAGVAGEQRDAGLLGRETKGEVVLVPRLRAALEKLNSTLPPEAIAITESKQTWELDPYWTHSGLMVDPSADPST
jgi:type I restriction enzyme R subunit